MITMKPRIIHLPKVDITISPRELSNPRFGRDKALFQKAIAAAQNKSDAKKNAMEQEARENYQIWADYFQILKEQYHKAWDVFGEIDQQVFGWHRIGPKEIHNLNDHWTCERHWGPIFALGTSAGFSGRGYHFLTALTYNGEERLGNLGKNEIELRIGTGFHSYYWSLECFGTEEMLGIKSLSDELAGLEACSLTLKDKMEQTDTLRQLAERSTIHVGVIYDRTCPQEEGTIERPIIEIHQRDLGQDAMNLFRIISDDRIRDKTERMDQVKEYMETSASN